MEIKYLTIGIKNKHIEEVKNVLNKSSCYSNISAINELLGFSITIEDLREDFLVMKRFLEENDLCDDNPFFNQFNIDQFALKIDFNIKGKSECVDILEPVVFTLGGHLSSVLKTEIIVMFDNMRIPVGLFEDGFLAQTFELYNGDFFINKIWKPNKI